ncbi:myb-like HTH transcriptional regulator family protein [Dorcoceras hygrometricum]|uniref:Myb-like HTH transcriptional regulator family protein n=1 Tax=Dorcoceras hygrometricum TaxID=472368 RepID=A0A2Z7D7G6_9LAMI|nr:myb-like HTH transcriptional regulator family protein [Dorcoceras hygrometricum]
MCTSPTEVHRELGEDYPRRYQMFPLDLIFNAGITSLRVIEGKTSDSFLEDRSPDLPISRSPDLPTFRSLNVVTVWTGNHLNKISVSRSDPRVNERVVPSGRQNDVVLGYPALTGRINISVDQHLDDFGRPDISYLIPQEAIDLYLFFETLTVHPNSNPSIAMEIRLRLEQGRWR